MKIPVIPIVEMPMSTPLPNGGTFWGNEQVPHIHSTMRLTEHQIYDCWTNNCYHLEPYKLGSRKIVVDLGANAGAFSFFAASLHPDVKVLAVEANPRNFSLLVKNIYENNMRERIYPVRTGVRDACGRAFMLDNITGSCILDHTPDLAEICGGVFAMETITLDRLFEENEIDHCDFMKVDIESSEWWMFEAARSETIARCVHISIEQHPHPDHPEFLARMMEKLSITHNVTWDKGALVQCVRK